MFLAGFPPLCLMISLHNLNNLFKNVFVIMTNELMYVKASGIESDTPISRVFVTTVVCCIIINACCT